MSTRKTSNQTILARNTYSAVGYCKRSNMFHINAGTTTLHLNPLAFSALCETITLAITRMDNFRQTVEDALADASAHGVR